MNIVDYADGINCPDDYDDEDMVREFVVCDDHELLFLDSYLKDSFKNITDV